MSGRNGRALGTAQDEADAAPRTEGADDEDRSRREERVTQADQRRDDAAEGESRGAEQCRGRAGVFACAVHGQCGGGGEGQSHTEEQGEEQRFVDPETAARGQC